ncbi:MAG: twin-arginine translocase subunit TatC [Maricaulaceae bacterium]
MAAQDSDPHPPSGGEHDDEMEASRAPLIEHFNELRRRLITSLIGLGVAFGICFFLAQPIYDFLLGPFEVAAARLRQDVPTEASAPLRLIFTAPLEFFFVKVKVALFGGLILAFPVIAHEFYKFVAPGLYKNERAAFLPFLIAAPVLFLMGAALAYYFVMPFVMAFALGQETTLDQGRAAISLLPKVSDYMSLITTLIIAFGVAFQLPVLLTLLARVEIIGARDLLRAWKYAVVGAFAVAMFLTPPDPISQIILGGSLMVLYFISVGCASLAEKAARKAAEDSH